MNAYITSQNIALCVVYLRNSRAITCDTRLDGNVLSRNLLRPELISASLVWRKPYTRKIKVAHFTISLGRMGVLGEI